MIMVAMGVITATIATIAMTTTGVMAGGAAMATEMAAIAMAGGKAGATIAAAGPNGVIIAASQFAAERGWRGSLMLPRLSCARRYTAVRPYSCLVTGWLDESPPSTAIACPLT